ncbi:MAG: AMP phosphorylase [Candidatus Micrarchaeota archaeon]|nr:AMP phosphorylase [Candidatus Micrarchaeota archaeon]
MVESLHHKIKAQVLKLHQLKLRAKCLDVMAGGQIVVLNATQAQQNDVYAGYRVILRGGRHETTAMVDLSNDRVGPGEIGLFSEVCEALRTKPGAPIELEPTSRPQSIEFIKSKLDGRALDASQMSTIVHDVMDNRLAEGELAAFMTACYIRDMSEDEVVGLTTAIVQTGAKFSVGKSPILDKHCIGGVAGNRTTMVIVPIMAAAGCYMPKTSSRAITSAAGTADTMETLCNVTLPIPEMEKQVRSVGGCIVWGGAINLAAADDKLIKIRNPLSLDPKGVLLASIMAKKKSVGAQYCIIDIPVGRGVKMADVKEARSLAKDFISIGKRLGITVECIVTNGEDPVGHGIGPALECRDVLSVLEGDGPMDLRDKSCQMAGTLLELSGKAKKGTGYDIAQKLITNGKALAKFKQIVEWQGGETKKLNSQSIPIGDCHHRVLAQASGRISHLDNKLLSRIARAAGAPLDKGAGLFLYCQKGDVLKAGQPIMDIYADSDAKLDMALKVLENYEAVELEKMVLDQLRE